MINVLVDSKAKRITIHRREACTGVTGVEIKADDLSLKLDVTNVSSALKKLQDGDYGEGRMWLEIDFGDVLFEHAMVQYVRTILSPDYEKFSFNRSIGWHC